MAKLETLYKKCWLKGEFDEQGNPVSVRLDNAPSSEELKLIAKSLTLKELWLFDRELTNEGLAEFVGLKLPNIEHLWVQSSQLTADGIGLARKWKKLREVTYEDYASPEIVDALISIKSLRRLTLTNSKKMTDGCLKAISKMSSLTELRVGGYGHKFTEAGLKHLGKLEKLKNLHLRNIKLGEASFKAIGCLSKLEELWLCDCSLKPDFFKHLGGPKGLKKLKRINLISAKGVSDQIFSMLGQMATLEEINLGYLKTLKGKGIESLANCKKLKRLTFRNAKNLDSKKIAGIGQVTSLEDLDISSTRLGDEVCAELAKLKNLKRLVVFFSDITNEGLEQLVHLPKLEHLDVEGISLKPATLRKLVQLPKIKTLLIDECDVQIALRKKLEKSSPGLFSRPSK